MIETLTGQPLGDILRERIWNRIGMKDTFYGLDDVKARGRLKDLASPCRWDEERKKYEEIEQPDQPEGSGCGEMISNVIDYAEFLRCMIAQTAPFSEEAHKELVKPRIICDTSESQKPWKSHTLYALGWEIGNFHGETVIGHGGSTTGFSSQMFFIPRLEWGVVALTNKDMAWAAVEGILWALIDDQLGVEKEKRFDWDKEGEDLMEKCKPLSKEDLFPALPNPPIPLSRPLKSYVGEYQHPGYGLLVVEMKDSKLHVDCRDRTWMFVLVLEHVSGEFFFVTKTALPSKDKGTTIAEFRLDVDGSVRWFGVGMEDLPENELVWFQKQHSKTAQGN